MSAELLQTLRDAGLTDFGSVIPAATVRQALNLTMPDVGTKADFDRVALAELAAIGYVRHHLLDEGKYITAERDTYRILLPSENAQQVEAYLEASNRKRRKGLRLLRSTPPGTAEFPSQLEARLSMRDSERRRVGG
jgi:hypothetical protein